jgi:cell division protein FtsB
MLLYREIRRRFTRMIGPVIAACLVGYFSYHMIQGNHGLRAYWRLSDELIQADTKLAVLKTQHDELKNRVSLMRDNICPDLLDEQVRKTLGYSHPHEVVIIH